MTPPETPKAAVIVPTILGVRSDAARTTRIDEILDCVRSILANDYQPLSIVVVGQTPGNTLAIALAPLLAGDARLRYIHTDIPGKSRAQNLAIRQSDADVFAVTDDDCVVPPDWVASIIAVFRRHPDAGLIFGDVLPPAGHDWATMFVPELRFGSERRLMPTLLPRTHNLMGADMAFTRATVQAIGLFDELLGPGSKHGAYNEEVDFHLRALRAKPPVGVYLTPAVHVVHEHGARPQGAPARQLLQTYQSGKSSFLTKHAMHGDVGAACQLTLLAFEPFIDAARSLVRSGKPSGIGMAAPYVRGLVKGVRVGLRSRTAYLESPRGGL